MPLPPLLRHRNRRCKRPLKQDSLIDKSNSTFLSICYISVRVETHLGLFYLLKESFALQKALIRRDPAMKENEATSQFYVV